ILGGIDIPYEKGLLGHSDADVLVHALMDAMLGAAALGDIGKQFPDSDDAYLGANSILLLRKVAALLRENGYMLTNADCTVVAQKPKLSPFIDEMRLKIAEAAGVSISRISVKATTEEKLGFTGEGLGIAAHAVVLIEEVCV
ncbi:MAG: 2-C-methyl-D-erythritol 2,4-cyclodiphosphate synthase, partial [Oscillospiraceae bacterium]|nr:2-C-methyl-D-erythritol 2,4-cyclodiphosphate synthase [Oscillospiraceae bacterium]